MQPGEQRPDRDETNEPSADGVYSLDRRPLIASIPADVSSTDGQITIDADADLPIRGAVSSTSTPHTGGVSQTIVYEFWSEDAPVWDEGSSSWDVSLYLQRTYDEPYLFSATISDGVLSSQYPPYGLAFTFARQSS